jgi:hypothetical protein
MKKTKWNSKYQKVGSSERKKFIQDHIHFLNENKPLIIRLKTIMSSNSIFWDLVRCYKTCFYILWTFYREKNLRILCKIYNNIGEQ